MATEEEAMTIEYSSLRALAFSIGAAVRDEMPRA